MDKIAEDLRDLSDAIGVSGFESKIGALISQKVKGLADEVRTDPLGNILASKKGTGPKPTLLLMAHMDELGFIVSHIDERGFIRFEKLGGWDDRTLLGQPVRFENEKGIHEGLIGTKPPHLQKGDEKEKVVHSEDMFVDIGCGSEEEIRSLGIDIGSPFTIFHPLRLVGSNRVLGKALDDRVGCAVLIDVLRRLRTVRHKATMIFAFSVCEEVGARGATTAAYGVDAEMGLAIEGTAGGDIPGIPAERCPTQIGKGPALTVADQSLIAHPLVLARLKAAAKAAGVQYQIKKPLYGATDASKIALSRVGVASGVLSVPCRYIHSGLSLLSLEDLRSCAELAFRFCTLA